MAKAIVAQLRLVCYRFTLPPRPQTCKDCWHSGGLDFHVPDALWHAVIDGQVWKVPGPGGVTDPVLCLTCFDRRAEDRGVSDYLLARKSADNALQRARHKVQDWYASSAIGAAHG